MVIKWQKPAQVDLKSYFKFTKTLHPQEYIFDLINYIDTLKIFPDLGKDYIEINNIKVKMLIYKMHKIFYYIKDNQINILKVAHGHMNEDTILKTFNKFFKW